MKPTGFPLWPFALLLLAACASTPKTIMLVPSKDTVPRLEALSHQAGTLVEALTVQRQVRTFRLDGVGASALTGASWADGSALQLPFDELALVYSTSGPTILKDTYPLLPAVTAADATLGCDALAVALARTEAIRWYARQQGGLPFTAHEVTLEHTKTGLKAVAVTALAVVVIGSCAYGGCSGFGSSGDPPPSIDAKAFRWAVTRADQRELGLLALKRSHSCGRRAVGDDGTSDLALLAQVDASREDLKAGRLSDHEQMAKQTQWLDALYGPMGLLAADIPGSSAADLTGQDLAGVIWLVNQDADQHPYTALGHTGLQGHLVLRADGMSFAGKGLWKSSKSGEVSVQFSDLADAVVAQFGRWRGLVLTYRDGRKDTLQFTNGPMIDVDRTRQVRNWLKGRIEAATAGGSPADAR